LSADAGIVALLPAAMGPKKIVKVGLAICLIIAVVGVAIAFLISR
jgi:hypothetical protein